MFIIVPTFSINITTSNKVKVGEGITLCLCKLVPYMIQAKESELYYLKDGKLKISVNTNHSRSSNTSSHCITISRTEFNDEGSYQCVFIARGIEKPVRSPEFNLSINDGKD